MPPIAVLVLLACIGHPLVSYPADISIVREAGVRSETRVAMLPSKAVPATSLRAAAPIGADTVLLGYTDIPAGGISVWIERRSPEGLAKWSDGFEIAAPPPGPQGIRATILPSVVVATNGLIHFFATGQLYTYTPDGARVLPHVPGSGNRLLQSRGEIYLAGGGGGGGEVWLLSQDGRSLSIVRDLALVAPTRRFAGSATDGCFLIVDSATDGSRSSYTASCYRPGVGSRWIQTWDGARAPKRLRGDFPEIVQVADGGFVLLGGVTPDQRTDRSLAFGKSDAWLGFLDTDGRKRLEQTYGGEGDETVIGLHNLPDSRLLLVCETSGSGISGRKRVPGDGAWVLQLDSEGVIENEFVLTGGVPLASFVDGNHARVLLLAPDGWVVQHFEVERRYVVRASAGAGETVTVESSHDLKSWTPVVTGVRGSVELEEAFGPGTRFFRTIPGPQ